MRKIVVLSFLTLDGVMQAPGGPEDGFDFGGWSMPYYDEVVLAELEKQVGQPFDVLLGKTTYEIFKGYWPEHKEEGPGLNKATKYVVSDDTVEPAADWGETVEISGDDIIGQIKRLKESDGPMLQVHGSGRLAQALFKNDLVDELWLKTFPVTLGQGKRLFEEGTIPAAFKLISSAVSPSGVIVANYKRDGDVKLGTA
jgi:dihydrofolate reductase